MNVSKLIFTLLFIMSGSLLRAQEIQEASYYFVGHSLVNFSMPRMVHLLAQSGEKESAYNAQIIIGSPLKYNFENPNSAQGVPYTTALPTGNYDVMIVTEAVPLLNHTAWSETYKIANDFLTYAREDRPDIRYYIYETWHCINTGLETEGEDGPCPYDADASLLWQPRLLNDFPKWAKIVDSVRVLQDYEDVYMVPAGQAFYNLSQEIDLGNVPGFTSFRELFEDDIHLTLTGNYFVACVMYACIYKESPLGLSHSLLDEWGDSWLNISEEVAEIMQDVAWRTVCENSYSGVDCSVSSSRSATTVQADVNVYPQPASTGFNVDLPGTQSASYVLTSSLGKVVQEGTLQAETNQVVTEGLSSGIYQLKVTQGAFIYTKRISIQ